MLFLGPSKRHGVGVFTTRALAPGTAVGLFRRDDWRFVRQPRGEERRLCRRYGVEDGHGFHCPKHWNRMSIGWYLNHSTRPTVRIRGQGAFVLRAIRAGAELTVDYASL